MTTNSKIYAYDYKMADGRKIRVKGNADFEKATNRWVLKSGSRTLGFYYPDANETKDRSEATVGNGDLLAGVLLLATAEDQSKRIPKREDRKRKIEQDNAKRG
jgi:hypothetical protein